MDFFLETCGSWRGIALQLFNIAIAIIIYIPFVIAGARAMKKQMQTNEVETKQTEE